jgi:hypothetical protein
MPSEEEITRIRRLINRIKTTLDDLTSQERSEIDQAVAAVRRHRAISLGMPRIRQSLPARSTPHDQHQPVRCGHGRWAP